MKFLAMLRDSLREAIDAKVFYVMVGLSLLLIALASTIRFTPRPGGKMVMTLAALPVSLDLSNLDLEEMQKGGNPGQMLRRLRGSYQVKEVVPEEGADDAPNSLFRVVLEPGPQIPFLFARPKPQQIIEQIEERFGQWDDLRFVEVLNVRQMGTHYEVLGRLTPLGQRLWPHGLDLFFGALPVIREGVPLGAQLFALEHILVNQIGAWATLLVSVVITAFFIPNMLRKGTVDMLIVKPISRPTLLLYKYLGGLLFIFLNTTLVVVGVWLALSLRSGIWSFGFLMSIPVITFFFAILYAVSTLFAVLTRSPIVAILMTCGTWFVLFLVGTINLVFETNQKAELIEVRRHASQVGATTVASLAHVGPAVPFAAAALVQEQARILTPLEPSVSTFAWVVRQVHFFLPRTTDLDTLMTAQLQRDLLVLPRGLGAQAVTARSFSWAESLTVSSVFIAVMLGVACWWFATRDY
ncbi:MAG: ABC transporter permease subunit [Gemmataceae bacterium]